jgi:serine/threonine protein kinase
MATASTASLVDALRQYRLLDPAQLQELPALQARFPDPKALARELIQRGWLTPYQANQLLQSKGQELVLGSYLLLERLGEGGMGQVFKARHRNLGRTVAVKLIRKERLDNPAAIKRFEREVRAAAALNHPNIVHAYDADQIGGTHLLVMECIEGATDLNRLVKQNGPLPVEQACEYIWQAALGLQHAYERGLVHRDIKPHNLLLTADGKAVKMLDMGLARLDHPGAEDDKSSTMTQEGAVMGTPDYIAPEQALASHTVDIRGDLYSLGCTFYFLLTGKVPFPGGTFTEKLLKHQLEQPVPVEQVRADVPPVVAAIVRQMMAKKPEERHQTPAELAAALAALFGVQSETSLAGSRDERTVSEKGKVEAQPAEHTFDSAFSYMAQGGDTLPPDAPARQGRKADQRRWFWGEPGGWGCCLCGPGGSVSPVLQGACRGKAWD